MSLAREFPEDALIVVQETEYTGAGKHPTAQLAMAREMGIEVRRGDPRQNRPGRRIVIPESVDQVRARDVDLDGLRRSYLGRIADAASGRPLTREERQFLAEDIGTTPGRLAVLWRGVMKRPRPAGANA